MPLHAVIPLLQEVPEYAFHSCFSFLDPNAMNQKIQLLETWIRSE